MGIERYVNELAKNLPYGAQRLLEIAARWPPSPSCCFSTSPRPV